MLRRSADFGGRCLLTGTMHGFDIVERAPIARAAVQARIDFLRQIFAEK